MVGQITIPLLQLCSHIIHTKHIPPPSSSTFVCVVVQYALCLRTAAGLIDDDSVHTQ